MFAMLALALGNLSMGSTSLHQFGALAARGWSHPLSELKVLNLFQPVLTVRLRLEAGLIP